ncbi:hypothetical protein ACFLRY_00175 [Bacteroidota bacterium]
MSKKVKSLIIRKFDYIVDEKGNAEIEEEGIVHSQTNYDEEGRILEELKFDGLGGIQEHYKKEYLQDGRIFKEISFDENDDILEEFEYSYEDGKLNQITISYQDGSVDTENYIYDNDGKLLEKNLVTDEGDIESKSLFVYVDDKLVEEKSFGEEGELIMEKKMKYNEKGLLIDEQFSNAEEGEGFRIINIYDEKGNLVGVKRYDGEDQLAEIVSYKLDEKNRIISTAEESLQGAKNTQMQYDENDNMIFQEESDAHGNINHTVERTFNEDGNVARVDAFVNLRGMGPDQRYLLRYEYELF